MNQKTANQTQKLASKKLTNNLEKQQAEQNKKTKKAALTIMSSWKTSPLIKLLKRTTIPEWKKSRLDYHPLSNKPPTIRWHVHNVWNKEKDREVMTTLSYHSFNKEIMQMSLLNSYGLDLTFHDGGLYHKETSTLICSANHWNGFYMIGTFAQYNADSHLIQTFNFSGGTELNPLMPGGNRKVTHT